MAGNMFVYDNTEPTRQILAEEAEPAHSCRAFRGLDLFVVLYVVGVIPVTHPSFRAGTSTLTTGIIPKTSTHNNRYASYLFTLPRCINRPDRVAYAGRICGERRGRHIAGKGFACGYGYKSRVVGLEGP